MPWLCQVRARPTGGLPLPPAAEDKQASEAGELVSTERASMGL